MGKQYSDSVRSAVLDRYKDGEPVTSIAASTSIARSTIYTWINLSIEKSRKMQISSNNYRLLEKKAARLEQIIEVITKAKCSPGAPLKVKLSALEALHGQYSVHLLCEALDVPRGTFYNHIYRNKRDKTLYKQRREELRIEIKKIYDDSNQIFGAKKICAILKERGHSITKEMVAELMRDQGLCSIRQDAKDLYKKDKRQLKNTLNQQFDTSRPDEVWVSDVTCFRTNGKNYYICVVLDLYSHMVISYGVSRRNSTQLIRRTFQDAFNHRSPLLPLTFHTDRGSNYRSETFCNLLQQLGVTQSFSKASTPYDNSVVESFFSSLKREELYRKNTAQKKNSERHWMNIWISIMLIGLMLIINTGHQRRQNVIITANMRISEPFKLNKGVQVVKLFHFSFRF